MMGRRKLVTELERHLQDLEMEKSRFSMEK
jgi:hypothetical protein